MFDLKRNASQGVQVLEYIRLRNKGVDVFSQIDLEDSKFVINLSSLFYTNLYLEEKEALQQSSVFIHTFNKWSETFEFKIDSSDNIVFADVVQFKIIKLLFEGQTRKMSSINFLRSIYCESFSKI